MSLLSVPTSELRRRTSLKWSTYPADVLPMWVAEMDVRLPDPVLERVRHALDLGDTGYPHGDGYAQAFAAMAQTRWSLDLDPTHQIVRAGDVMNSILALLQLVTQPGDAVVVNPPIYPPFRKVVQEYQRTLVEVPLTGEGRLDLPALMHAFAGPERPRAYLLCTPHNPTGTVHTAEELTAVMAAANAHHVQVIADEIHAPLVDPGTTFTPTIAVPGGETALVATSAGKAWNLAGFKAGLVVAGTQAAQFLPRIPPLARESAGHLANLAHSAALTSAQGWVDQLMLEIAANKELLRRELATHLPSVRYHPTPGTYLAWVDCTDLGLTNPAQAFRDVGRVAFSPGVNFAKTHRQWVRINLACSPDLVVDAVQRMVATVQA